MVDRALLMNDDGEEIPIPPSVTLESYRKWRSPCFGRQNPERMTNPVWDWLIRTKVTAFAVANFFDESSSCWDKPGWCFDRFGQTVTVLPDGRKIFIAGEHEDHYDPDFHIYNDVVVWNSDESVEVFGYPEAVFPPTDFHSATLIHDQILIIGNLGHPAQRSIGPTPVFTLDLTAFTISPVRTTGESPGNIYNHAAKLVEGTNYVSIRGGKVQSSETGLFHENEENWRLHLTDWRWERDSSEQ